MNISNHEKSVKRNILAVILIIFLYTIGTGQVRTKISIPDILGYITLKCDFHMHTVFSDGEVWPSVRAKEAWIEGLDCISITDHTEKYLDHKEDLTINFNRIHQLAAPNAKKFNIILIKGTEITKEMPPGHFNAIFLTDINTMNTKTFMNTVKAAIDQGAFVFWNHPLDENDSWHPIHTELYEKGWLQGIEIVNGKTYYPEAHQWALDKKLTMIGNSDTHEPINFEVNLCKGSHRTLTLVFVKKRTIAGIKEALLNRRTVVYWKEFLIGESKYLEQIFNQSIHIMIPDEVIHEDNRIYMQIHNTSDISYHLTSDDEQEEFEFPKSITLPAHKTVLLKVKGKAKGKTGEKMVNIHYRVQNLLIVPGEGLQVEIKCNLYSR